MRFEIEKGSPGRGARLVVVGLIVLASVFLAACGATPTASGLGVSGGSSAANTSGGTSPSSQANEVGATDQSPARDMTRTSEGGQVTVEATWAAASAGPVFTVSLDTHSVDLDSIDLTQSAVIRTDRGVEVKPLGWDAPKGGHHRGGTLTFPTTVPDGTPLIGPDTRVVELVIRGVAGVPERTLRWELSS